MTPFLPHRGQIDVGHVGTLVSKETGDGEMGVQSAHAVFRKLTVLFGGVGVPETVERQRTLGVFVAHYFPVADDELRRL